LRHKIIPRGFSTKRSGFFTEIKIYYLLKKNLFYEIEKKFRKKEKYSKIGSHGNRGEKIFDCD